MKLFTGISLFVASMMLLVYSSGSAQQVRPKTDPNFATVTGTVAAYEEGKSITVEFKKRGGLTEKREFAIIKDKTKLELIGVKAIQVGAEISVWADKDEAKNAAKIVAGDPRIASMREAIGTPPTAAGKVTAYEADKSITVEVKQRNQPAKIMEFAIIKDKTKVELQGDLKSIVVGTDVRVFADQNNAKNADRIIAGVNNAPTNLPTATGKITAYEADKSIAVEVKQRNQPVKTMEFTISKDKTKVELFGDVKALAVGIDVRIWADKDDAKLAARIATGTAGRVRPNNPPVVPKQPDAKVEPTTPKVEPPKVTPPVRKRETNPASAETVAQSIDKEIQRKLDVEKIRASALADDAEFLRRVYLDITGVIPPADKAAAFLDSKEPNKRAKLMDELLASPKYGTHFADLWCDRVNVKDMPIDREPFIAWLSSGLNQSRGWDEIVFDMMTAGGQFNFITRGKRLGTVDPQSLFLLMNTEEGQGKGPNPGWLAAESGRLFLGVQIQCAECHNHPFTDSWMQTDFWGMAAFFSQLKSERTGMNPLAWKETPIAANKNLSISIPATALKNIGKNVPAKLLGTDQEFQAAEQQLLRHTLANWMTATDNPYFAKAAVNRMWAHLFGRGLVNPVDDLRPDNQPSHPAILDSLTEEFKKSGYDFKHLIRCICLSQAYQRTSVPLPENESDQDKYSHQSVKVMGPGIFYDSLKAATGLPELKVGLPERKTKLAVITTFTPREVFVDFFRSSQGEEASPLENTHGIPQALKLMNAAQLSSGLPNALRMANLSRDQAIEQLYLTALARRPSESEGKLIADFLAKRKDARPEQGYGAVLWTLMNSAEFISNH